MEKAILTVENVGELLGIGKNKAYALVKQGEFPVLRIANRFVIPKEGFYKWLNSINGYNEIGGK